MSKIYIGAEFTSNSSGKFKVVAKAATARYWVVKFVATGYETTAKDTNIPYGKVKDYWHPSVYGVGYHGASIKKPKGSYVRQVYDLWANMLKRVYGGYGDHWNANYTEVEVDPAWHNFLVFMHDIQDLPGYEAWEQDSTLCLDKDLKDRGAGLYSKHTCQFISNFENLSEASNNRWNMGTV